MYYHKNTKRPRLLPGAFYLGHDGPVIQFEWRGWDLNPQPTAYESVALPLSYLAKMYIPWLSGRNITMLYFFCQQNHKIIQPAQHHLDLAKSR